MSELLDTQMNFSKMIGQLIDFIYASGYTVTFGEAWRTPEQAALNAQKGIGIKNSLHCDRLAVDFNFFKDAGWINTPVEIGEYWEKIGGSWGGRFGDPPHFSVEFGGRK